MNLVGNKKIKEQFGRIKQSDNLSHAYLFCGPSEVGKTTFAIEFAKLLLCEAEQLEPCNKCQNCKSFNSQNNPDFIFSDSNEPIGVDEMRGIISSLDLSPYNSKYKVVVIANIERATTQSINSFLKTLEEPTKTTKIILTAKNKKNLLPTIVSRTQIMNFSLVDKKDIREFMANNYSLSPVEIEEIVEISVGKIGKAISMAKNFTEYTTCKELSEETLRAIYSNDINEKFIFAEKLSKDKEKTEEILSLLELKIRKNILENSVNFDNNNILKDIKIMDNIVLAKDCLKGSVNLKLALESLLLTN